MPDFEPDDLSAVLHSRRLSEERFEATIPQGWQQGKPVFGGLVLGTLLQAVQEVHARPDWPLRVLNAELVAPVLPGPHQLEVEVIRQGSGVATFGAVLRREGERLARVSAVFGKARVLDRERVTLEPPKLPPLEGCEVIPVEPPFGPIFAQQFRYRSPGPLPYSSSPTPISVGWLAPKRCSRAYGAPEVVALIDAWWPADLVTEEGPRLMSTVTFTFEPWKDPSTLAPGAPLVFRASVPASHEGFSLELRELWTAEGELLALNQQTFVRVK